MIKHILYADPIILPLDCDGKLYTIQDERGNTIGTGTREICEVLVHMMKKELATESTSKLQPKIPRRQNLRAAIEI
jgi:hypothetical protein